MANEVLIADNGYVYTNGETYGESIYLSALDSPANWWQIPVDEIPEATEETEEIDEDAVYAEVARILLGLAPSEAVIK